MRRPYFFRLEENKVIIRRWFEAENKKDLALLDEFVASDFIDNAHQLRGLEAYKQFLAEVIKGYPDCHETIEDMIAEGDRVWVRYQFTGTHTGEYQEYLPSIGKITLPPTGKKITMSLVDIFRLVNGKVVEWVWAIYDGFDFLKQLGLIDYSEKAKKLFQGTS
ncbi:ester cyclase [Candidatus Bathyarchaeota archaeon]|nr:ester cyclase [Candidatus Bathyarchaeota archaeon]